MFGLSIDTRTPEAAPARRGVRGPRLGSHPWAWRVGIVLSLLALAAVVVLGGVSWHYSGRLYEEAIRLDEGVDHFDLEVLAIGEGFIDLKPTRDAKQDGEWTRDGTYGLTWEAGYTQVGGIIEIDEDHVRRVFEAGVARPAPGTPVRLDSYAFEHDPLAGRGIPYEDVSIAGELGRMDAWFIPGDSTTWAIFVHGRHADRAEALRMLPTVTSAGLNALVVTYRNDAGAPRSPDAEYHWGTTEWADLDSAVAYAGRRT